MSIDAFINQNARNVGGLNLFSPEKTKQLVRLLINGNKKILGIDGLFVTAAGTRPSMEDSINTEALYKNKSPQEIEEIINTFIAGRLNKNNLFYEIVF